MQYQVPQFIETEDRVVGPFSLRQFAYVGAAAIISGVCYFLLQTWLFFIVALVLVGSSLALSFIKVNGRPLVKIILSAFNFYWKPQIYVWKSEHAAVSQQRSHATVRELPPVAAIASGSSLHKSWESLQTGTPPPKEVRKTSDRQFVEKKMAERYPRYFNDRAAIVRRHGAWIIARKYAKIRVLAVPSKQDAGNSLDLVDIQEIKQNTVIVKDGSFRQIVMVGGVNFSLKSEMEQNIITQGYQTFLNSIDFPLQILIHSRKVNIGKYIETLTARKEVEQSPILQNQIDEYSKFIEGFVEKNAIMEKVFLVVVSLYPTSMLSNAKKASGMIPFFGKKKESAGATAQRAEETQKIFNESLAQLTQRTSQVTSGLLSIGLEATVLDDEQLVELFYNFYNPQTVEHQKVPAPRE